MVERSSLYIREAYPGIGRLKSFRNRLSKITQLQKKLFSLIIAFLASQNQLKLITDGIENSSTKSQTTVIACYWINTAYSNMIKLKSYYLLVEMKAEIIIFYKEKPDIRWRRFGGGISLISVGLFVQCATVHVGLYCILHTLELLFCCSCYIQMFVKVSLILCPNN